jgi:hypothetical protein
MQHYNTVQQVCLNISFLNSYILTAALSVVALELSTYSVEQTARSKCCTKTYGIY